MKLDTSCRKAGDSYKFTDKLSWPNESKPLVIEWENIAELRQEHVEIIGRLNHNMPGAVLTSHGEEVAMVLPLQSSKIVLTLMHLLQKERNTHADTTMDEIETLAHLVQQLVQQLDSALINAAMDVAAQDPDQTLYDLEELIAEENASNR